MRKTVGDYRITKLDKRYNGHQLFRYRVSPFATNFPHYHNNNSKMFRDAFWWAWDQWGPSLPLHMVTADDDFVWSWSSEEYRKQVFFKDDEQLTLFVLAFSV